MVYQRKKNLNQFGPQSGKYRAFSIIEVIVGILIIGVMGIAFFAVMNNTLKAQFRSRDKIIATNLAQEGIEIVRNTRDNNWKDGIGGFSTDPFSGPGMIKTCYTNHLAANVPKCSPLANYYPTVDMDIYDGDLAPVTVNLKNRFTRTILIINCSVANPNCRVRSTVSYGGNSVVIEDNLFTWADT